MTRNPDPTAQANAPAPVRAKLQHPREGSKRALAVQLMSRPEGATLPDLMQATGWLPHTTRAALTGLRKRGFAIGRVTVEGGPSAYLISAPEPEPKAKPRSGRRRPAETRDADLNA